MTTDGTGPSLLTFTGHSFFQLVSFLQLEERNR